MCLDNDCMCQATFVQRKVEIKVLQLSSLTLVFPNIYYGNWFTSPLPKKYFKILVCNFVWDFLLLITIRLKRGEKLFSPFFHKKLFSLLFELGGDFGSICRNITLIHIFFFLNPYRNKTFVILFSCGDIQYFLFCKVKKGTKSVSYAIYILRGKIIVLAQNECIFDEIDTCILYNLKFIGNCINWKWI